MSSLTIAKVLSSFEIYGMKFSIETYSQIDMKWVRFILRNYMQTQHCEQKVHIKVPQTINGSYMRTYLTNQNVNKFVVKYNRNSLPWQSKSTPIPPFLVDPYRGNYVLLHGCAVLSPNKKVSIFLGDSMTGKTYLSILLIKNGYQLIADDLIIFRIKDQVILPYHKPIGLRETTIEHDEYLQSIVDDKNVERLEFTANSGKKTWLIHVEDIWGDNAKTILPLSKIDKVILLNKNCTEIESVSLSKTIVHLCSGIMNSGLSQQSALTYLIKIFSNVQKKYFAPTHAGTLISDFIQDNDNYE